MIPRTFSYNSLASLTIFRILFEQNDIYDVIYEFIKDIIISENLHSFSSVTIKEKIFNIYNFKIPEAIIRTALKRHNQEFSLAYGKYNLNINIDALKSNLPENSQQLEIKHQEVFNDICKFIANELGIEKLSIEKSNEIIEAICDYILNPNTNYSSNSYADLISVFLLTKSKDETFLPIIDQMREAVILYMGISYCNDFSSTWKTPLTIFLNQEVIFDLHGLNGIIFKERFLDLYNYINEINQKNKNRIIEIKYFQDTKNQIDIFYNKAKRIFKGIDSLELGSDAMESILNSSKDVEDIEENKIDLFTSLKTYGIHEDENEQYYSDLSNKYNLSSDEILSDLLLNNQGNFPEDKIKRELKLVNQINILRKSRKIQRLADIEYTLVTRDSCVFWIANNENIQRVSGLPLACEPGFLTNKFWFSLQKGFGDKYPQSFSIITKAKILLSSHFSRSINECYEKTIQDYKNGKLSKDQAIERLTSFRKYEKKPEDINEENSLEILPFLSKEIFEKAIIENEERLMRLEITGKELKKKIEENKTLEEKNLQLSMELDKNKRLNELKEELVNIKDQLVPLDIIYNKTEKTISNKILIEKVLVSIIIIASIPIILFINYATDYSPLISITIGLLPSIIISIIAVSKEKTIKPVDLVKSRKQRIINNIRKKYQNENDLRQKLKHREDKIINEVEGLLN